jgi:four helix bundle protein
LYYSRGSAKETLTALRKAKARSLTSEEEFTTINQKLDLYFKLVYGYIQSIGGSTSDGK